jgi:hypothetical protein
MTPQRLARGVMATSEFPSILEIGLMTPSAMLRGSMTHVAVLPSVFSQEAGAGFG